MQKRQIGVPLEKEGSRGLGWGGVSERRHTPHGEIEYSEATT
jgi:hypothetical protein